MIVSSVQLCVEVMLKLQGMPSSFDNTKICLMLTETYHKTKLTCQQWCDNACVLFFL